jgi:serine/threonine protein kinase
MEKSLSIKSPSFINAQHENRRRRYSISSSYKFDSRSGTPIRRSDIIINRLSRRNLNSNKLFPLINNEIEKYNILSKLNIGMFGSSYLIRDSNDGQMYILKRIDYKIPDEFRQRLFEERCLLGCLKSNYILSLISSYMDIKHNCYSMKFEYINGITLLHLLRQIRWFEESAVAFYCAQIVLAFEYLHELNIIYVRINSYKKVLEFSFREILN